MKIVRRIYHFIVCIPDHLYPFSEVIDGERVRWKAAYDHALLRMNEMGGFGHYGAKLIAYRSVFHILGSLLFIGFATLVSQLLFGNLVALYALFGMAAMALIYQEFYYQPRVYGEMRIHGIVDVISWLAPFGAYLVLIVR